MEIVVYKFKETYLNQVIKELPSHCLLDKGITGCGGTTVELESKRNSIILCPTRNLVTSKSSIGYFGVDGNVTKTDIKKYIENESSFKKIVATYDALPKLIDSIENYQDYFLLIDEYHLLFNDYSFRGDVIKFILKNFNKFKDWCFMTATPLKDEFILEELKDIDKVIYKWENSIPVNIHIEDTYYVQKIILDYINKFSNSKNLHIFLNSVTTIHNLIKNIDESSYRVVCSENSKTKIKNFNKITSPVKKINFYTSCSFEGCDIYDPDGICIIVCDTVISTTVLDIATKIRQVCGRLRDSKYKNECYLILNTSKHRYAGTSKKEFELNVKESEELGKLKHKELHDFPLSKEKKKMELRLYNKEKYATLYLNKYKDDIYYDENLKKIDVYNYNLISEIYNSSISVIGELGKYNIPSKIEENSKKDYIEPWILENLIKNDYTYSELEKIFTPIFEEHGLKWNKNNSIKYYFPLHTKKQRTINHVKEVHYIFNTN
jgi:hypothetical protein